MESQARARGNARRRRRVPAFGEWNHNGDANGSWPATATPFFDLAAAHKPPQTERRDGEGRAAEAKLRRSAAAEAHGRRQSKVADSGAYAARKSCFTVVAKAVDDDLYGVPPDMLYQKPPARKRGWLIRILLMAGCVCPRRRTFTA
ncbi:hypothetical protein EJB05_28159 [Eragrostis curvula]|uniref:Uncharacterized protein n=1 Tax=Eragrostis curvula TaxID=38414 RepID=A0A5J9UQ75_9POAL|nr:hypothetical protein EJB05_28159 [Eragrostis curvula]